MMSRTSIRLYFVVLFLVIHITCFSQQVIIGARDELAINGAACVPMGEKSVAGAPTLLANMNIGYSFDLRYTTTLFKHIQFGAWIGNAKFSGWSSDINPNFLSGSSISFRAIGPALGYTTSHRTLMTGKKLGFGVWIMPGISNVKVETTESAGINGDTNPETLALESTRLTVGLSAGVSYVFTTSFGIRLLGGYRYTNADSKVFADASYSSLNVGLGMFYRIHFDRRFKYSHL